MGAGGGGAAGLHIFGVEYDSVPPTDEVIFRLVLGVCFGFSAIGGSSV
jgi:hypothetical protein